MSPGADLFICLAFLPTSSFLLELGNQASSSLALSGSVFLILSLMPKNSVLRHGMSSDVREHMCP